MSQRFRNSCVGFFLSILSAVGNKYRETSYYSCTSPVLIEVCSPEAPIDTELGRERKSDLKFSKSWPRGCQEAVIIRLHTTRTEIGRKITECKRNFPHLFVSMYDCSIIVYRLILLFPYTLSFCL